MLRKTYAELSEEEKARHREAVRKYKEKSRAKIAEYSRRYRENNPEAAKAAQERYQANHPGRRAEISRRYRQRHLELERKRKREYMRKRHATLESFYYYLRYYYGAGADLHYAKLLTEQNGKCAICKLAPQKERLHLDHNHKTKQFRGLLCGSCNRGLGLFKENIEYLKQVVSYLEKWS